MDVDSVTRIGDAERERAVAAIGEHYAAGRLDHDDLEERMEAAWRARTQADLAVLFTDLPGPSPVAPPAPGRARDARGHAGPPPHPRRPALRFVAVVALILVIATPLPALLIFPLFWFIVARVLLTRMRYARLAGPRARLR